MAGSNRAPQHIYAYTEHAQLSLSMAAYSSAVHEGCSLSYDVSRAGKVVGAQDSNLA